MPRLITPFAELALARMPLKRDDTLQAFDAADAYLLEQLHSLQLPAASRVLILNDSFGALALSLAEHFSVTSSGDSYLAEQGLRHNQTLNQQAAERVNFVPACERWQGPFAAVLIRIPKTLSLLEEQLIRLHGHLAPQGVVIAGAMLKHLPRSAGDLLERYIGPVQASLAQKKARLLTATLQHGGPFISPYPSRYALDEYNLELRNHANVFSRDSLDIGSRAFLPHLPHDLGDAHVADLGCGNGVLALVCAQHNPHAQFSLFDESYMAVQSAAENWRNAFGPRAAHFIVGDGLADAPAASLDAVLCNPPFHQQQVVGDHLALRMFSQAHRALKAGGSLWLVGNRHLGYHAKLKRQFREVRLVASTPKFVILQARK
ncbi:methyltransferase [Atopomonas sediminilitoris]|uniref:methyltransferase n=1 Tax=Atopomonas sediminilitoris TaxID=2919919 RepID=UPI001F4EFBAE|nr:methyltransferase [Atopomonas sediminilitoris]MCJ8170602.1 methyltransferase [Atopomonas sediminilitoris]